jgi:hypothetical protein
MFALFVILCTIILWMSLSWLIKIIEEIIEYISDEK